MRVHLPRLGPIVDGPIGILERLASLDRFGDHELTDDPEVADVLLFSQCHMLPRDWRLITMRGHPLTKRFPDRVMSYDERDHPWCAFPGVYVSMPAQSFDWRFQRAWGYFPPTDALERVAEPDLLFSFIGSPSSRCRRALFELRSPDAVIEKVDGFTFYDPTSRDFDKRRKRFRSVMSRSRFVLCPRGKGTSSIRLYEALAFGCVPVVMSDNWVTPDGPEWQSFCIRWPEGRIAGLVETLQERNKDWARMSTEALAAYRAFFSADVTFHRLVEELARVREASTNLAFPRRGVRNRAFLAAGVDVARWRTESTIRRVGKRVLTRLHLY